MLDFGNLKNSGVKTAKRPAAESQEIATVAPAETTTSVSSLLAPPIPPGIAQIAPVMPASGGSILAITTPLDLSPAGQNPPSLLNPPALNPPALNQPALNQPALNQQVSGSNGDITGSIARPPGNSRPARVPAPPATPHLQKSDRLPIAIGGPRLRSAAVAGDAAAAYEVAVRFAEGRGVPANLEDAAHWYERAASKGLAPAQFRYASLLEKGQGVKKDLVQARRLYLAAAAKGNGKAMHNLAVLYAEGIEGKPDYGTAAQWFRKAALRGIADSQYNLGVLCARGLGTDKNFEESYKWFALAAAQGDKEAAKKRDEVAGQMDAGALGAARNAVNSFTPEPQPDEANNVREPAGGWDRAGTASPSHQPPSHQRSPHPGPLSLGAFTVEKR